MTDKKDTSGKEEGGEIDMYHFKSRLDMILFAAFIIILLLMVLIYMQFSGAHPA